MLRINFLICLIFIFCFKIFADEELCTSPLLVIKMKDEPVVASKFRSAKSPFQKPLPHLNRQGLDELNISASGQFSKQSLEIMLQEINWEGPFYLMDLRQEMHGFVNGDAITLYSFRNWGNKNKTREQIEREERLFMHSLRPENPITLHFVLEKEEELGLPPKVVPVAEIIFNAITEAELAKELNIHYIRIPITDHLRPTDEEVDRFVKFVHALPDNSWIHFHCSAGVGRATTAMVMFDMMKNAKQLSFDEILARQAALGGKDLATINMDPHNWKLEYALEKLDFLKRFYNYCQSNADHFETSWQESL